MRHFSGALARVQPLPMAREEGGEGVEEEQKEIVVQEEIIVRERTIVDEGSRARRGRRPAE